MSQRSTPNVFTPLWSTWINLTSYSDSDKAELSALNVRFVTRHPTSNQPNVRKEDAEDETEF